jgi:hypothetical protein
VQKKLVKTGRSNGGNYINDVLYRLGLLKIKKVIPFYVGEVLS